MSKPTHVCTGRGRCAECGRKALFSSRGKKAHRGPHAHSLAALCPRHWRALIARVFAAAFVATCLLLSLGLTGDAQSSVTTTVIGTFRDVTGAVFSSGGQVTFELRPGVDTTISGNARFVPTTTTCTINQSSNFTQTGLVRVSNVVTATFTIAHQFLVGDTITVSAMGDTSFNGTFTVATVADNLHITWATNGQPDNTVGTGGGAITALRNSAITAPCTVTQNTALQPLGTSYNVCIWPGFAQTSCFNWYAIGAGPVDLSTAVPTPSTLPSYAFVDTFSAQTIGGNKTFSGNVSILGLLSLPGAAQFSGSAFSSNSANPSTSGIFRLASGDTGPCWRNNANTGNLCFSKTAGDVLQFNGSTVGTGGTVTSVAMTVPSYFSIAGSPITTSGTLALTANGGQTQNQVLATPNGSAGALALRSVVMADLSDPPEIAWGGSISSTTAANLLGAFIPAQGVTVTTFLVQMNQATASCTTAGVVAVQDNGSTIGSVTINNGSSLFTSTVNTAVSGGHTITVKVITPSSGCTTGLIGSFTTQYKMQ
jgi:hypothetical protein